MPIEVVVPDLGESVLEATVARWIKREGEFVSAGESIVELETDKANLDVSAERNGTLQSIRRHEGEDVSVGEVLAIMEESVEAERGQGAPPVAKTEPPAQGAAERTLPEPVEAKQEEGAPESALGSGATSPGEGEQNAKSGLQTPVETRGEHLLEKRVRMSRRRRTIATRLVEAQRTAAMLTTFNEADMSAVMQLRQRHKESFEKRHGVGLGLTSFFVKASVAALREFPLLNAEIDGDEIVVKHYYDIGIAVGDPEGLVVPVLHHADRLSFAEIEQGVRRLVEQVQQKTLSVEDLRGGTFTITNGGVFGSLMSTPILNPPQVGILGLHKIQERAVVLQGEIKVRPMMYLALSYDHRIVDGREAVQFLVRVKEFLEDPDALLIES